MVLESRSFDEGNIWFPYCVTWYAIQTRLTAAEYVQRDNAGSAGTDRLNVDGICALVLPKDANDLSSTGCEFCPILDLGCNGLICCINQARRCANSLTD